MSGLGEGAADIYGVWALFLMLGCLGPHLLVVGVYLHGWSRNRPPLRLLVIEFVYGFVNPVVYLLVFQPALFRRWTPGWLPWLCWLGWATYWVARVFGEGRVIGGRSPRLWVRPLLHATVALIAGIVLRDFVAALVGAATVTTPVGTSLSDVTIGFICLPLYALPMLATLRQLATTRSDETWATSDFFFRRLPAWVLASLLGLCGLAIVATLPRATEDEVRALLLRNRDTILAVSREHNLDPRLLASIVAVTQRDIDSLFRAGVENLITDVWLTDPTSHMLLAEALDPSLGLSQVKAHTLLAGYAIHKLSDPAASRWLTKDYRSVRALSLDVLERVPAPALRRVSLPTGERLPGKREVVEALKSPDGNLAAAAFLLDLVASQWEAANPDWSIRRRPDIMATLFQLGFERSVPKADPIANDFGARVQRAFTEPWMVATFTDTRE